MLFPQLCTDALLGCTVGLGMVIAGVTPPRPPRLPTDSEYATNQNIGEFGKEMSKAAFCIFFNFLESFFNFSEGCHKDRAFLNRLLIKQLIRFFSPNLKGLFAGKSKHWRFLFSASVLAQPFNF